MKTTLHVAWMVTNIYYVVLIHRWSLYAGSSTWKYILIYLFARDLQIVALLRRLFYIHTYRCSLEEVRLWNIVTDTL